MRAALIPMKGLAQAKMRLADLLDGRERRELVLAMLTDVIVACSESRCFDLVAVVTNDNDVCSRARDLGARPIVEPDTLRPPSGIAALNNGLTFGRRYLARRVHIDELVILPADLPLARADDVRAVVDALGAGAGARAVLVRSADGGTNALALRPPEAIAMRFGRGSADAHRAEAEAAGIEPVEIELERLRFDVDAPADVAALSKLPLGAATRGWLDACEGARAAGRQQADR
ncbi:MAG: 2-phospho-L-lactate guanylyltransferase [Dehalococcoidia bacterium]|nr:2-phospho-L-lactate guanylyltransferase [Dehalococcoidia bacterium]